MTLFLHMLCRPVDQPEDRLLTLKVEQSVAGWSSPVARWAHNPKVPGSNPGPATISL